MNAFPLYDNETPLSVSDYTPTLAFYEPSERKSDACIVIFPGGGYSIRAPYEGDGYAKFFQENGICSFVCEYRVNPESFPRPLLDARRAVRYARANAEKYGYSPDKILVMGSSAGGHLASLVSNYRGDLEGEEGDSLREVSSLPNGTILCYPVIDMMGEYSHVGSRNNLLGDTSVAFETISCCDIVDEQTPPAFLWHTAEDTCVHVANSYIYSLALRKLNIPSEVHVFPFGRHGLGLCAEDPHVAQWSGLLLNWMKMMNF